MYNIYSKSIGWLQKRVFSFCPHNSICEINIPALSRDATSRSTSTRKPCLTERNCGHYRPKRQNLYLNYTASQLPLVISSFPALTGTGTSANDLSNIHTLRCRCRLNLAKEETTRRSWGTSNKLKFYLQWSRFVSLMVSWCRCAQVPVPVDLEPAPRSMVIPHCRNKMENICGFRAHCV